jgi:uncharacterized protein
VVNVSRDEHKEGFEMYTAIILILVFLAVYYISIGIKKNNVKKIVTGVLIGVLTWIFFSFMDFWGEYLWFQSLGYTERYLIENFANLGIGIIGALTSLLIVYLLVMSVPKERKVLRWAPIAISVFIGASWGYNNWDTILKFFNKVPAGIADPIFGKDAGFYLFTLPFLDQLFTLLTTLTFIALATALIAVYVRFVGNNFEIRLLDSIGKSATSMYNQVYRNSAIFIFVLAFGKYLDRYHLMFSSRGAVMGPGWTDVNIQLPAYAIVIIITILLGFFLIIPPLRNKLHAYFVKRKMSYDQTHPFVLTTTGVAMLLIWFVALTAIPGLFQVLRVEPNEITFERPYIVNNIKLTRYAFNLNNIEEKEYPAAKDFTQETVSNNPAIFSNIRLWDWRALEAVYKQFQEIRLYYEFHDVDIDRYKINNRIRQVMVSAREMNVYNLPPKSQTFVNKTFQYTHGYGITMTTVNDFTDQGLPNLLIKDIPPVSRYPELNVTQPQIYYGELTNNYVVANSKEKEFDYPKGDDNAYTSYKGGGGVQLSNIWRKFLFGWKFDGTQFFLSGYSSTKSRILFHRQIEDRIKTLAPFIHFDQDPYIVLSKGKLYWIIDGYTASDYFPYSQPFSSNEIIQFKEAETNQTLRNNVVGYLDGENYVRNSVKAVVNAYNGDVDFYIFDKNDPIIKVWSKIFPHLFKPESEMPEDLLKHVRYPIDYLLVQGLMYAKYHMQDPTVFYNQEDLWVRATEKYYDHVQPVDPYYIVWELPGSDVPQFVLMMPFTPKGRQVMIGWIAGMCDPKDYGKFIAYNFSKDKRIIGPQQVETKIDQDSFLSGQLSLWNQRGSQVIRGNVLAIPVEETLFYVEPIYLQAQTAAYPELRLVAVMHDDNLSYAPTFKDALNGLFNQQQGQTTSATSTSGMGETQQMEAPQNKSTVQEQIDNANTAFENYLKLQGEKKFEDAAKQLEKLQQALQELQKQTGKK